MVIKRLSFILLSVALLFSPMVFGQAKPASHPTRMAVLQDKDIALRMYGENLTWGELKKLMARDGVPLQRDQAGNYFDVPVSGYVERLVRLAVTLNLVRRNRIELSDGERAKYLEMIRKELEENKEWSSFEEFVKRYPSETKSIFNPCLADVLRIAKYNSDFIADVTVTDDDVIEYENRMKAGQIAVEQFNKRQRRLLDEALAKNEVDTDEKFAEFAKKYSEGKEAEEGGLLGEFPRWLVAGACELEDFEYKAGETSKVIVTKQAFRLMRVLAVKPPKKEGEDEMVKISQILLTRYPEQEIGDREATRRGLLRQKQSEKLEKALMEEVQRSGFVCPLFPMGLFTQKDADNR